MNGVRRIIRGLGDLPAAPSVPDLRETEIKLEDGGLRRDGNQFQAVFRALQAHYGLPMPGQDLGADRGEARFVALLGGLSAQMRRLEAEEPEVIPVGPGTDVVLRFHIVPIEVPRFSREQILGMELVGQPDDQGRELRSPNPEIRVRFHPDVNLAWVEIVRGGAWDEIDHYNPRRER